LVAFTVKVDEFPEAIDVGLAVMATDGAGDVLLILPPPQPVNSSGSKIPGATQETSRRIDW
jgi:hypothetical protein